MYLVNVCRIILWDYTNILFLIPSPSGFCFYWWILPAKLLPWCSPSDDVHLFFIYELEYYEKKSFPSSLYQYITMNILFYGLCSINIVFCCIDYFVVELAIVSFTQLASMFFSHDPSFLDHPFTFWHHKLSQAHLVFSLTNGRIIHFQKESIHFIKEWYIESIFGL